MTNENHSTTQTQTPNLLYCDLLTIEAFAEKMAVKPGTIRNWIDSGELIEGRHYIKICSVTRIPWPYVLKKLLTGDKKSEEVEEKKLDKKKTKKLSPRLKSINLDY